MTNYVSTRGDGGELGFSDTILQGLAPDKGLYIPSEYPSVSEDFIRSLSDKTYQEIFVAINRLFVGEEIEADAQRILAGNAFSNEKFDTKDGEVTPLTWLDERIAVQQLSLGPTAAFKDMALQPMAQQLNYVLNERNEHLRMLGATSGDTGSSAEAAIKGLERVRLTMLSPLEGMSAFQRAQMGELSGDNIQNLSVDGRFDDCQDMVKALKAIPEFSDLGAVNSINWGRVAAQVPYYFSGYIQAVQGEAGKEVDFVVPSGNFGNVLAGYIAKKMGLPIRNLIVATNENNVLHELVQTGVYKSRNKAHVTSSPSMDITKASNYERLAADIFQDPAALKAYMEQFERTGQVSFEDFKLPSNILELRGFDSGESTHTDRLNAIRWAHEHGMLIDPHTADALTVALRERQDSPNDHTPLVCMSTALPVKFEETIHEALGFIPERPERFVGLEDRIHELANVGFAAVLKKGDLDGLARYVRELQ